MGLQGADSTGVDSGAGAAAQGGVVGIVDVGVGARGRVAAGGEGGIHQLLVGGGFGVPLAVACLADVQGALGSEGLGEGAPAVAGIVAHMVAKQAAGPLRGKRDRERALGEGAGPQGREGAQPRWAAPSRPGLSLMGLAAWKGPGSPLRPLGEPQVEG